MTATQPTAKEALLKRAEIVLGIAKRYDSNSEAMTAAAKLLRAKFYLSTAKEVEANAARFHAAAEDMRREHAELIRQADAT